MALTKNCPLGKKHVWFKRYCYHEGVKHWHTGRNEDGITWKNVYDFKTQEYTDLYFPGEGPS